MASDAKLYRGTVTDLGSAMVQTLADGAADASAAFGLGTDVGLSEDEYRVVVSATEAVAIPAGVTVDVYVALGSEAGDYDGDLTPGDPILLPPLANLTYLFSVVGDGVATTQRRSGVAYVPSANAVIVVSNATGAALTALTVTVQPLNMQGS